MYRRATIISHSSDTERFRNDGASKLAKHRNVQVNKRTLRSCLLLTPLISLFCIWLYATIYIISSTDLSTSISLRGVKNRSMHINRLVNVIRNLRRHNTTATLTEKQSVLITRNTNITITSSARGNLGPPSVLNQDPPGHDWLKDRWQAGSDMHGSAIPGSHWVLFDFSKMFSDDKTVVYLTKVVLDWETAFASDYRIESRVDPFTSFGGLEDDWCVLYDGGKEIERQKSNTGGSHPYPHLSIVEYGQSPGVKEKLPLHIIHTIDWSENSSGVVIPSDRCHAMRYLRIFIRKSARGWGVSLWQVDAFGFDMAKL